MSAPNMIPPDDGGDMGDGGAMLQPPHFPGPYPELDETAKQWSEYLQIAFRVHKEQLTINSGDVMSLLMIALSEPDKSRVLVVLEFCQRYSLQIATISPTPASGSRC